MKQSPSQNCQVPMSSPAIATQFNCELEKFEIQKSQEDPRLYRGIHLFNGMKVLLISDPATDKSAACLCVETGHMSDPNDLPGLAHFCEHMLFLGMPQ